MKNFLIIDTATKKGSISLSSKNVFYQRFIEEKNQTKEIIPIIKNLLQEHQLSIEDIDKIGVCIGPGAFTGSRVGVMTAKTLSYSLNIPLVPFSTFDVFEEKEPFAILDAKCRQCYLLKDKKLATVSNHEVAQLCDTIYYIEENLEKLNSPYLTKTEKNLSLVITILEKSEGVAHNEIEVFYPKDR